MNRKQGFTLVELLVVIAIISILAGIVIPKVGDYIGKARSTRALSEIKGAELAITKMLSDVDKKSVNTLFDNWEGDAGLAASLTAANLETACRVYSDIFYELLRRGKEAEFGFDSDGIAVNITLKTAVKQKLATSYMDMGTDPWGTNKYYFYAGPLPKESVYITPFRCYREPLLDSAGNPASETYIYNQDAKDEADMTIRGNPQPDGGNGYPSPKDLPVYIFSIGANEAIDQEAGGGDDINNWDNAQGWSGQY